MSNKYKWKEETPVSRLIDSVGRQKARLLIRIYGGVYRPFLFLLIDLGGESINKHKRNTDDVFINEDIKCKSLLVITDTGEKLGVLSKQEGLREAAERGLDLVLVSPDGNPPVAKMMDYSKFRFEQQKKSKEMKKNQKTFVLQEIRLSPTIEKNDFDTKSKKARKMIEKGNKVKVSLRFFGRMIAHQDLGVQVVNRFVESLADIADVESPVKLDGRSLFSVLAPKNQK